MKRQLLLLFLLCSYAFLGAQTLNQPNQFNNVCDDNNDGYASFYMMEISSEIIGNNQNLVVTHHETQTDATVGVNPLPSTYMNIVANSQTIWARVVNTVTSQVQIISYNLTVNPLPFATPYTMTVCETNTGNPVIDFNMATPIFLQGNPSVGVTYHFTLTDAQMGVNPLMSPYYSPMSGNQTFYVRLENNATGCFYVTQLFIVVADCPGVANDLTACADTPNSVCFDLSVNTPVVLGSFNPANYTVSYHATQGNASAGINPLPTTFCPPSSPYTVYARLAANNGSSVNVSSFTLTTNTYQNAQAQLPAMIQCDDNTDGTIFWNLTTVQAQLNTTNALSYYTSLTAAQNMTGAIPNPAAYATSATTSAVIFIREIVVGGCDIIYTLPLNGYPNCNLASTCSSANSLCNSLGVPFNNTVGIPSGGSPACLGSIPNPTWFYLPVSSAGNLNFTINQGNNAPNFNNQDVDFICWGPFTSPQCVGIYDFPDGNTSIPNNVIACSYSSAPVETFTIPNTIPGQYYMLLVTNFSNQSGQILINQTNTGQPGAGAIDCSGLGLVAFLDANNNGTKDNGEQNFPLGQFHYEKNNDGIVHHITAPSGVCNIYDMNNANSYDVNYTVDASYAAMYNVAPASYANLSVVLGSGLSTYYFPVTSVQNYNDLAVTIIPMNAPRPGFTYQEKIQYTNFGNQNITSGTITFNKDANVTITNNTQLGTTPTATGFTYNFSNLAPFESRVMTVTMQVPTIPTVAAGQVLTNTASIAPLSGDVVVENNTSVSGQVIINAYDPNDKMEAHGGRILHSTFTSNDYLYYTIRFENTGTASAIDVRVNDVLDSQLDETSVRMVSASHIYELDRVGSTLNWKFDNIQLPVSVANSTIGKGYITFKVKPKAGYAVGDIIPNTASIYFDFNPAIVTNTFNTQFVNALGIDQFASDNFVFYPNPTSDYITVSLQNTDSKITGVKVYDVLGKTIYQLKANNVTSQTIDLSEVTTGMYFMEVTSDSNQKITKKIMVK